MNEPLMSKSALLAWVKEVTNVSATRLEDLSTGQHFCHLLHIYTKGKFPLQKIKKSAKTEIECLHNLRNLQYGMEEAKIPYKLDITRIAKRNFKTILETLQWWQKQFLKLPTNLVPNSRDQSTVTFKLKKKLQLVEPVPKEANSQQPIKKEVITLKSPPQIPNEAEVIDILGRSNKYSAPKEKLIIEDEKEQNKENEKPLYPSLEYESNNFRQEKLDQPDRQGKEEVKNDEMKSSSRAKADYFSFGRQEGLEIEQKLHAEIVCQAIQPSICIKNGEVVISKNVQSASPSIPPRPSPIQQERAESRFRSVGKADHAQPKYSTAKGENPSTKPKSIPKHGTTPQRSRDKQDLSPKVSEHSNLLSLMEPSEKKVGRMM